VQSRKRYANKRGRLVESCGAVRQPGGAFDVGPLLKAARAGLGEGLAGEFEHGGAVLLAAFGPRLSGKL
jgi:hypothetical protein